MDASRVIKVLNQWREGKAQYKDIDDVISFCIKAVEAQQFLIDEGHKKNESFNMLEEVKFDLMDENSKLRKAKIKSLEAKKKKGGK